MQKNHDEVEEQARGEVSDYEIGRKGHTPGQ